MHLVAMDSTAAPDETARMGVFLGREEQLAALEVGLREAAEGQGRLFLLVGEAGIGKTRLADELCSKAAVDALWGRCWEAGGAPAYWPFIEVLRPLIAAAEPQWLAAQLGAGAAAVASLLPELRERLPGLPPAPLDDGERARFVLFDAIARLLRAHALREPLVIVLDDLHVADQPSLRLLEFIARGLRGARLLILGAYRPAEARLSPAVSALLASVERDGERLLLDRWQEAEVAAFMRSAGEEPEPKTVAAVLRASEGTPLFVKEIVRALASGGGRGAGVRGGDVRVPDGLRPAIRAQLARAGSEIEAVLQSAAIIGREFGLPLLRAVHEARGLATGELAEQLGQAERAGLLAEIDRDGRRFRFGHILIRETIYEELGAADRERWHGLVGAALEALGPAARAERAAEIAHHYLRADPEQHGPLGVRYAQLAGNRALAGHAHEEAVLHFTRALAAFHRTANAADRELAEVLLALAEAHRRGGDRAAALATCARAADVARALGDPALLAEAALRFGTEITFGLVDPRLVTLLEEALAALDDRHPPALRARVMARLAAARQPAFDPDPPVALAKAAVALARTSGDRAALARVLRDARAAYMPMDNLEERTAMDLETLALAHEVGDQVAALEAERRLAGERMEAGELSAAVAHLDQHDRLADALREPYRKLWSMLARSSIATACGRFAEAERLLAACDALAAANQDPNALAFTHANRGLLLIASFRQDELPRLVREHSAAIAHNRPPDGLHYLQNAVWSEDRERAREFVQRWAEAVDRRAGGLSVFASCAELLGDRDFAARVYARLLPWSGRYTSIVFESSHDHVLARLATMLGRDADARRHHEDDLAGSRRIGARAWEARALVGLAASLERSAAEADRRRAAELRAEARALGQELGIAKLLAEPAEPEANPRRVPAQRAVPVTFTLEGEYWTVRFGGTEIRQKDSKGLRMLVELVQSPGRELHALQLTALATGEQLVEASAAATADQQARNAYKARAESLQADLREAEAHADLGRAERVREELELLANEIAGGIGLGGRERAGGSTAERARINVQRRISDAIQKLERADAELGRHLGRSVRTGNFCVYEP